MIQRSIDIIRTCDSLVPNQERYQLRYTSISGDKISASRMQRAGSMLRRSLISLRFSQKRCKGTHFLRHPQIFRQLFYLMMPCSTKIFFSATTERSTWSFVCVAISA